MGKKDFTYLLKHYLLLFEKCFINAVNTDEEEAIHELRIAIKRLQSLLLLFQESSICTKHNLRRFKNLKKVFKISGALREYQIKNILIGRYKLRLNQKLDNYQTSIDRRFKEAQSRYWKEMKNISFAKLFQQSDLLRTKIVNNNEDKIYSNITKFVSNRILKSYKWLVKTHYRDYLHKIRKYLKDIRFTTEKLKTISQEVFKSKFKYVQIKKAENMLGEWHDLDLFYKDIRSYRRRKRGYVVGIYDNLIAVIRDDLHNMEIEMHPILLELFESYFNILDKKDKKGFIKIQQLYQNKNKLTT